ncbi:hypothetical protein M378DRAFT_168979 [Amanita muscaria Koide BX008]|uniref:Uncharacterized protein n=1 Tax=Amanita muscaria (strain Koide BX008) TaxID=946122 RepID=A0A0C2WSI0_AMAMK|nr:hypothetical protein M378DRAFT_168979 [Amanita muscaria Koide BX008]
MDHSALESGEINCSMAVQNEDVNIQSVRVLSKRFDSRLSMKGPAGPGALHRTLFLPRCDHERLRRSAHIGEVIIKTYQGCTYSEHKALCLQFTV